MRTTSTLYCCWRCQGELDLASLDHATTHLLVGILLFLFSCFLCAFWHLFCFLVFMYSVQCSPSVAVRAAWRAATGGTWLYFSLTSWDCGSHGPRDQGCDPMRLGMMTFSWAAYFATPPESERAAAGEECDHDVSWLPENNDSLWFGATVITVSNSLWFVNGQHLGKLTTVNHIQGC